MCCVDSSHPSKLFYNYNYLSIIIILYSSIVGSTEEKKLYLYTYNQLHIINIHSKHNKSINIIYLQSYIKGKYQVTRVIVIRSYNSGDIIFSLLFIITLCTRVCYSVSNNYYNLLRSIYKNITRIPTTLRFRLFFGRFSYAFTSPLNVFSFLGFIAVTRI